MQLLKLNLLNTGTEILLNRSHIQSARALVEGTAIRTAYDKLPYVVSQSLAEVALMAEYISGIIIPLTIRTEFGSLEQVSVNVDTIIKVVQGFEENTAYVFLDDNATRYLALNTVNEIEALANSVEGGGGIPGDTSNIESAYIVNLNVIPGANVIVHGKTGNVATVYVKFSDSWMPWAWDDVSTTQVSLYFDEAAVVQVRILLTKTII